MGDDREDEMRRANAVVMDAVERHGKVVGTGFGG
jgi:hypothetical protein